LYAGIAGTQSRAEFHEVFKRLRDRISTLSTFYGEGPVEADFRGLGERAEGMRTISGAINWMGATGRRQEHGNATNSQVLLVKLLMRAS